VKVRQREQWIIAGTFGTISLRIEVRALEEEHGLRVPAAVSSARKIFSRQDRASQIRTYGRLLGILASLVDLTVFLPGEALS
jgi:hypothetical protein